MIMKHIVLEANNHSFFDSTDFCLFSLVTNMMQWLSYLVIAWVYDFQFSASESSLGPVHVVAHVYKFDLQSKNTC